MSTSAVQGMIDVGSRTPWAAERQATLWDGPDPIGAFEAQLRQHVEAGTSETVGGDHLRLASAPVEEQVFHGVAATDREGMVRRAAEELVANALLRPMFQMMRQDPLKSDLFPMSNGEKAFGPLLDAELGRRLVTGSHWPIVDVLTERLLNSAKQMPLPPKSADEQKSQLPEVEVYG